MPSLVYVAIVPRFRRSGSSTCGPHSLMISMYSKPLRMEACLLFTAMALTVVVMPKEKLSYINGCRCRQGGNIFAVIDGSSFGRTTDSLLIVTVITDDGSFYLGRCGVSAFSSRYIDAVLWQSVFSHPESMSRWQNTKGNQYRYFYHCFAYVREWHCIRLHHWLPAHRLRR